MDGDAIAGRYRLEERLGIGGMAEVWSAEDVELERRVAIKFLGPGADDERFQREALAAASLSHPNICQLYDYGAAAGRPYMVLEYLPGGTLEDRLATGRPLSDEDAGRISRDIAAGLQHAHEKGLVHRDLKPANILFDAEGRAKIADFGIARAGGAGTITDAGTLLGTAAYLSPEQAVGEPATTASDVYSFGAILYRMLSGRLPFESEDALELARKHRDETPPPLAGLRPDAPPGLESLAMASLAKSPSDRPPDGGALARELGEEEGSGPLVSAEEPTRVLPFAERRPAAARPNRGRRKLVAAIVALGLLGAGVAAAVIVTGDGGSAQPNQLPSQTTSPGGRTETGQRSTEPISTQPETTVESTTAPTEPVISSERTTAPTEPFTTEPTEPFTTTVPPPLTTAPTITDPPFTDVTTFLTDTTPTEPLPTTGPGTTVEPGTTAGATPTEVP